MKSDFVFTSNYIELLADQIVRQGYELYVYDFRQRKLMDFKLKKVKVYFPIFNFIDKTPLRIISNFLTFIYFSVKNKNNFDIVHVLYIRPEFFLLKYFVKQIGKKLVLSIFGSDISVGSRFKSFFKGIFYSADQIHCQNPEIYEKFLNIYIPNEHRELMIQKRNIIEYPVESLKILSTETNLNRINKLKAIYNISNDDILILCGTTARIELEQLYPLVKALKKSSIIKMSNIRIIFPLTYGGKSNVTQRFKEFVYLNIKNKDKIIFIENYLDLKDILALRDMTDIFINVRLHDQLVTSMIEALYCKSYVITGDWLPYNILKENKFFYYSVKNIDDISNLLPDIINHRINKKHLKELNNNRSIIMDLWNPDDMIIKWNKFYSRLL